MNLFEVISKGGFFNVADYKICCGCESVVFSKTPVCPVCSSFRYVEEPKEVHRCILVAHQRHVDGECLVPDFDSLDRLGIGSTG